MDNKAQHTILDDRHEIYSIYTSSYTHCWHFNNEEYACAIYPAGIPFDILESKKVCPHVAMIKK